MLRYFTVVAAAVLLSQCADKSGDENAATEAAKPRSMNERFNSRGKEGYYQDGEGNWKIKNDKRSSFESVGKSDLANRQFAGTSYNPGTVQKKSWWGNTTHQKQAYAGNTSANQFKTNASDAGKTANEGGVRSLFSRKSVTTQRIDHKTVRESGNAPNQRNGETASETMHAGYQQPDIIDWKEQRSMQINDTKSWLKK